MILNCYVARIATNSAYFLQFRKLVLKNPASTYIVGHTLMTFQDG